MRSDCEHSFVKGNDIKVCSKCGWRLRPYLRLSKDSCTLLEEALSGFLDDLWEERADLRRDEKSTTATNREIRRVTSMLKNITAMKESFGWTS